MRYEVDKNECWNFTGNITSHGYGRFWLKKKEYQAHRIIAHILIKPLMSEKDVVAHKCDNPRCVNPDHLFITTHAGNSADRDAKGRGVTGENSPLSKLTADQVRYIRHLYQTGTSMGEIAKHLPVTYGAVQAIVRGRTWKNLT